MINEYTWAYTFTVYLCPRKLCILCSVRCAYVIVQNGVCFFFFFTYMVARLHICDVFKALCQPCNCSTAGTVASLNLLENTSRRVLSIFLNSYSERRHSTLFAYYSHIFGFLKPLSINTFIPLCLVKNKSERFNSKRKLLKSITHILISYVLNTRSTRERKKESYRSVKIIV